MPRYLIIDGYNLLGVHGLFNRASDAGIESAREQLILELSRYRQRKPHPITVVFDAWQQGPGGERREHRSGVEVMYSRRGERADQVIQRLAADYGPDCAVVSSDHEVVNFARARGALVIASQEFASKLQTGSKEPRASSLTGKVREGEDIPSRRRVEKKGNPKKLPKAKRKRLRQLKSF